MPLNSILSHWKAHCWGANSPVRFERAALDRTKSFRTAHWVIECAFTVSQHFFLADEVQPPRNPKRNTFPRISDEIAVSAIVDAKAPLRHLVQEFLLHFPESLKSSFCAGFRIASIGTAWGGVKPHWGSAPSKHSTPHYPDYLASRIDLRIFLSVAIQQRGGTSGKIDDLFCKKVWDTWSLMGSYPSVRVEFRSKFSCRSKRLLNLLLGLLCTCARTWRTL